MWHVRREWAGYWPMAVAWLALHSGCFDPSPFAISDATSVIDSRSVDGQMNASADASLDATPSPCTLPPLTLGLSTLAGCDDYGYLDGPRGTARFQDPVSLAVAPDGTVVLADFDTHTVRRLTRDGTTSTIVRQTNFRRPFGVVVAADGTTYVETDDNPSGDHSDETGTIWRIQADPSVAIPMLQNVGRPRGMLALADGRIVLADNEHHVVRIYDPAQGVLTPLAGTYDQPGYLDATGSTARFNSPYGLALLPDGRIAVADFNNHRIRAIALDGTTTTLAGTGALGASDGSALEATFARPQALAAATDGTLYITDIDNYVVRRLRGGVVDTIAGDGTAGSVDAAAPRDGRIYGLEGLALDESVNRLYVTDGDRGDETVDHHRVRIIDLTQLMP